VILPPRAMRKRFEIIALVRLSATAPNKCEF
jgi:hypothetical protein